MGVVGEMGWGGGDLQGTRMLNFGPKGVLLSDVRLADWQPLDGAAGQGGAATPSNGAASFPRTIRIDRPHDDYKLDLQVTKVSMNEEIPAERFKLEPPAGSGLVHVGEPPENKKP